MTFARRAALMLLCVTLLFSFTACTQNFSRAYNKAIELFADGEFAEAAKAFDKLGDYAAAPTYAAYSHGLVLYEQGQYGAAEPYFAASRDFMYGEERYQYCHAHVLMESALFAEAAEAFHRMGEFEDAPMQYQYCHARDAENNKDYETALYGYEASLGLHDAEDRLYNLQGQLYNRAIALRTEGNYQDAITLFIMLGDYLSSAAQAVECREKWLDQQYEQADALESQGDLQGAFDLFYALSSYRDAANRAHALADILGIEIKTADNPF